MSKLIGEVASAAFLVLGVLAFAVMVLANYAVTMTPSIIAASFFWSGTSFLGKLGLVSLLLCNFLLGHFLLKGAEEYQRKNY